MIIRPARTEDLPGVLHLAQQFYDTSEYGRLFGAPLNVEKVTAAFDACRTTGAAFVAESEIDWSLLGMIGLLPGPHPFTDQDGATEIVWFVAPESRSTLWVGPRLEEAAREWALHAGLSYLTMTAPAGSRVGHYLHKKGYRAVETTYHMTLKG